jgi:hypothetical protein
MKIYSFIAVLFIASLFSCSDNTSEPDSGRRIKVIKDETMVTNLKVGDTLEGEPRPPKGKDN